MGSVAQAVTDLVLGLVTLACAVSLRWVNGVDRAWHATFWLAAASALAGAAHHGLLRTGASWTVVGVSVVLAISYLLIGTAREMLGRRGVRIVVVVRVVGVAAYAVAVLAGESGLSVLLLCESLTMASILGLWLYAAGRGHPMARPMIVAILAHGLAGIAFALPAATTARVGLDPTSLSHLAQIPGVLLFYRAVAGSGRSRR